MKKYLTIILFLLILVGCAPEHTVEFDLTIQNDHAGVFRLVGSVPQSEDENYDLVDIKQKLDNVLNKIDNFKYGTSNLILNDKQDTLEFTYDEVFNNIAELNGILNRFSEEPIRVEIETSENNLINKNIFKGLDIDERIFFKEIYEVIKKEKLFGLNSNDIENYQEATYFYELLLETNVEKNELITIEKSVRIHEIISEITIHDNKDMDLSFEFFIDPEDQAFNYQQFSQYVKSKFESIQIEKSNAGFKAHIKNFNPELNTLLLEVFGFEVIVDINDTTNPSERLNEVIKDSHKDVSSLQHLTFSTTKDHSFLNDQHVTLIHKVNLKDFMPLLINDSKQIEAFKNKESELELKDKPFDIDFAMVSDKTPLNLWPTLLIFGGIIISISVLILMRKKPKKKSIFIDV